MPAIEALLGLNALWQFEFLLGLAVSGTVLLAMACAADRLLRPGPASRRLWLWGATSLLLLAQAVQPIQLGTLVVDTPAALTMVDNPVPLGTGVRHDIAGTLSRVGIVDAERHTTAAATRGPGILAWLFALWAAVVLLRWGRLWYAGHQVSALIRHGQPASSRIVRLAYDLMPQAGRYVRVVTTEIATPFTFGWRFPVVSLPTQAEQWSDALLRSVLLHEFTHVRRGDWARQVAATVVAHLYWFHPLARLGVDRLTLAAELRCDEQVLSRGVSPRTYAEHLLAVVGHCPTRGLTAVACFAEPSAVETRMRAMLRPASPTLSRTSGVLALSLMLAMPLLAAIVPRLGECADSKLPVRFEWSAQP
jgi:beta-lactamase regulating signal transducer with metallopeptidase domain